VRNFTIATPEECRALERLAAQLRGDLRVRARASGLPIVTAFELVFGETATKAGCR
jgi:hypothetical protein